MEKSYRFPTFPTILVADEEEELLMSHGDVRKKGREGGV